MNQGTIKFYNAVKGYGFIIGNETGEEVFFHVTGLLYSAPQKDDIVNYEIEVAERGKKAIEVKKA